MLESSPVWVCLYWGHIQRRWLWGSASAGRGRCGRVERQAGWSRQWPQRFRLGRRKGGEGRGTRDLGSCASIFTHFDSSRVAAMRVSAWPGTRRFQEKPTKVISNTFEGWLSLRGCPFEGRLNGEKKNIISEIR